LNLLRVQREKKFKRHVLGKLTNEIDKASQAGESTTPSLKKIKEGWIVMIIVQE